MTREGGKGFQRRDARATPQEPAQIARDPTRRGGRLPATHTGKGCVGYAGEVGRPWRILSRGVTWSDLMSKTALGLPWGQTVGGPEWKQTGRGGGAPRAGPVVLEQLPRTLISRLPSSSRDQDAWLNLHSFVHSLTQLLPHTRGHWDSMALTSQGLQVQHPPAGSWSSTRLLRQEQLGAGAKSTG